MKVIRVWFASVVMLSLPLLSSLAADTSVKSGPQVDQVVPGPFHPLNCTGEFAGQKHCLFCQNGENPVAITFARKTSGPLTKLVKRIDQATAKNAAARMGSFVVFLSGSPGAVARAA